jgi:hypothetical protein
MAEYVVPLQRLDESIHASFFSMRGEQPSSVDASEVRRPTGCYSKDSRSSSIEAQFQVTIR